VTQGGGNSVRRGEALADPRKQINNVGARHATAVILQGIAARSAKGQASSAMAELVGKGTPVVGAMALYAFKRFDMEGKAAL
jgi:hypothetical protein